MNQIELRNEEHEESVCVCVCVCEVCVCVRCVREVCVCVCVCEKERVVCLSHITRTILVRVAIETDHYCTR